MSPPISDEDFVAMPDFPKPTFPSLETLLVAGPKLQTPATDRLIGNGDSAFSKEVLDVAEAQAESVIQPNSVTDNLRWKPVTVVSGLAPRHRLSLPDAGSV